MVASHRQHCKGLAFPGLIDQLVGSDVQEWSVQRWTNLHGREAGDAPSAQSAQSHAQYDILGFLCRDRPSRQGSISGTRLSACAHRMNGVSGLRHTKVRRIRCVLCEQAAKRLC